LIVLLLALIAVNPPAIEVQAFAGEEITMPFLLAGSGSAQVSGSGVLSVEHTVVLEGVSRTSVPVRVRADATPGVHEAYLYFTKPTDEPLVLASAVRVTATVLEASTGHRSVPRTAHILRKPTRNWALGVAAIAAVALGLFATAFFRRGNG
jgi:hypothetical protein